MALELVKNQCCSGVWEFEDVSNGSISDLVQMLAHDLIGLAANPIAKSYG